MDNSKFHGFVSSLCLGFFLLMSGGVSAEMNIKGALKLGGVKGGDEIFKAFYVSGDVETTHAGDGFIFEGGIEIQHAPYWESTLLAGYKSGGSSADNGDVTLSSFPIEAITFYRLPRFRFGAGMVYHLKPKFKTGGVITGVDEKLDDSAGVVWEVDWFFKPGASYYLGVRGVSMDFTFENGAVVDASSVGLTMGGTF